MFKENEALKSVDARSYLFLPPIFLQKSQNAHRFWIFFFRGKDVKIQAMIYEEQLHYKLQPCPIRAGGFL